MKFNYMNQHSFTSIPLEPLINDYDREINDNESCCCLFFFGIDWLTKIFQK